MMPACSHTGTPRHFHSSMTSGTASWMSFRMRLSVSPRQSPSSAMRWSINLDADGPGGDADFFIGSFRALRYALCAVQAKRTETRPLVIPAQAEIHEGSPGVNHHARGPHGPQLSLG